MTQVSIREPGTADANALPIFDLDEEYAIIISDPFTEGEGARLEWHFEEHLRFPFAEE